MERRRLQKRNEAALTKAKANITHSTYKLVAMNSQVLLQGCAIIEYFAT